jgi:hypothetical protein
MKKDIIQMSRKELGRLPIVHKVMEKRLTQLKASEMLDLSDRQIRRIIARIRTGGNSASISGEKRKRGLISGEKENTAGVKWSRWTALTMTGLRVVVQGLSSWDT